MPISKEELKKLKAVDVMSQPQNTEAIEIEQKIADAQKGSTFTMKLTAEQLTRIRREAEANQMDWKTYLKAQIVAELLDGGIGRSTIAGPSFARGSKINGPSWMGGK